MSGSQQSGFPLKEAEEDQTWVTEHLYCPHHLPGSGARGYAKCHGSDDLLELHPCRDYWGCHVHTDNGCVTSSWLPPVCSGIEFHRCWALLSKDSYQSSRLPDTAPKRLGSCPWNSCRAWVCGPSMETEVSTSQVLKVNPKKLKILSATFWGNLSQ